MINENSVSLWSSFFESNKEIKKKINKGKKVKIEI